MYVVLAELDKGPMLGRKREKLFSGNCPKIIQEKMFGIVLKYPEKILGADGKIPKNPEKIYGRTERFQNILKRF